GPLSPERSHQMNPGYAETFTRHRILLSAPIVLAVFVAIWFILGTPASYEARAALWIDSPTPQETSLNQTDSAILPPAAQAQSFLNELLPTREFRVEVGRRGPLAKFLAAHRTAGWSPTAMLRRLRGAGSVDDRVVSALGSSNLTVTVQGPQVLAIR